MVLGTPEAQKVFQLALDFGHDLKIYILPVVYLLVMFWIWRLRRMTFEVLLGVLGIVFLLVASSLMAAGRTGEEVFAGVCQTCHQAGNTVRAPLPEALRLMPRERIATALETGAMKAQGAALSAAEI